MKGMSFFKIGVLIAFIVLAIIGAALFATGSIGIGTDSEPLGEVEIWGTLDERVMQEVFAAVEDSAAADFNTVTYTEKNSATFDRELTDALAAGNGPDLFLLSQDAIVKHQNKVRRIPFESVSERDFKNAFIQESELYLAPDGILGMPFYIDPLVMYWNRSLFSSAGIANPPRYWDTFFDIAAQMTKRNAAGNIEQSAVALGEYRNINNAKAIISTLIMQAGNSITARTENGALAVVLAGRRGTSGNPAEAALNFYTTFSNPVDSAYSWNRSLPQAQFAFLGNDLAIYFGFASELRDIRAGNPNLNFDVAAVPQTREGEASVTFGRMYALAIPKGADNPNGAFRVATALSGTAGVQAIAEEGTLPPVRRDLLAEKPDDAFQVVFYDAALQSRAWLEPDADETDAIFRTMVEGITSGRRTVSSAVRAASGQLEQLIP